MLIIMDNCEHLIEACAKFIQLLLGHCGEVTVLATSREPLAISGEVLWQVLPLSLPEAIRLFIDRAQLAIPGFKMRSIDRPLITDICRRLEGIPLAIELAGGKVRTLGLSAILEHLDLELLSGGTRDGATRHRSVWATMDWSYKLLTAEEQRLFRWLSVFEGGWTIEAADAVCRPQFKGRSIDLLSQLVSKSLIVMDGAPQGVRYRFLEMLRQFAAKKLADTGEAPQAKKNHYDCFVELAETAAPELFRKDGLHWHEILELEQPNFVAAMNWSLERGDSAQCLRISGPLWQFWWIRGHLKEGQKFLEIVLSDKRDSFPAARADAFCGLSFVAWFLGYDSLKAAQYCRESIKLAEHIDDGENLSRYLAWYGHLLKIQGRLNESIPVLERSLAIAEETGDLFGKATCHMFYGETLLQYPSEKGRGKEQLEKSLEIYTGIGNKPHIAFALDCLGGMEIANGNYARANEIFEECFAVSSEVGNIYWQARTTGSLGQIAFCRREVKRGFACYARTMAIYLQLGMRGPFVEIAEIIAEKLVEMRCHGLAALLSGAVEAYHEEFRAPPHNTNWRRAYDNAVNVLQETISDSELKNAQLAGRGMSMEDVLELVRSDSFLGEITKRSG